MTKTPQWVQTEQTRIEKQQAQTLKDRKDFWICPVGTTKITITDPTQTPRYQDTRYGDRKIFKVVINGKEEDYVINPNGPHYRELIELLTQGKATFNLTRAGIGRQTRYSITPWTKQAESITEAK